MLARFTKSDQHTEPSTNLDEGRLWKALEIDLDQMALK
jgi:hypothetical protein